MPKKTIERIGITFPPGLLKSFDRHIKAKGYRTRSKAINDLVREELTRQEWESGSGEVIGVVTLVYDHHVHGLSDLLTDIQHENYQLIVSTTHIHIDPHNCLEILIMRGSAKKIRPMAEKLISCRGVLHGKTIFTTTGKGM
ncbi:MAG: nickel-responsive transcriptional regulator NikR [Candidatus Alcyoniella australis]|nr:nickel-responsive transcriptional regulator NikR [Candidatus Alcyoniella australis]